MRFRRRTLLNSSVNTLQTYKNMRLTHLAYLLIGMVAAIAGATVGRIVGAQIGGFLITELFAIGCGLTAAISAVLTMRAIGIGLKAAS